MYQDPSQTYGWEPSIGRGPRPYRVGEKVHTPVGVGTITRRTRSFDGDKVYTLPGTVPPDHMFNAVVLDAGAIVWVQTSLIQR